MTVIDPSAQIGKRVEMGENVVIYANVTVGDDVTLGNGVVLREGTWLGDGITVFDNTVLGRMPQGTGGMTRQPRTDLPPLSIGGGSVVGACAALYAGTQIGENVLIGDIASIREECEANSIIARGVTVNYDTKIGQHVKIMDNTHITGNMIIEDNVFISVLVATTNDNTMDRAPSEDAHYQGPIIRLGASVGAMASILPGVEIGEYAVVGSGSVVTHDVPARKVVLGVPARVVKDVPAEWIPEDAR